MIIRSAGFRRPDMIRSSNAINFAYLLYLWLVKQNRQPENIERIVKRWFVMSILTSRATGSFETQFDRDIKQIDARGVDAVLAEIEEGELGDGYWKFILPQHLHRANASSPFLQVFLAAQSTFRYKGFLSKDILITDLLEQRGDIHHVFPKAFMKKNGRHWGEYNQVANLVLMQQEINIRIGSKSPKEYMSSVLASIEDGTLRYGAITSREKLIQNLEENAVPELLLDAGLESFEDFLAQRRQLMASTIKRYYQQL